MKIDKLYLSDFRGIEKMTLDLKGNSTVLFGINGVGKTTILSAINLLYAPIINKIVKQRFKQTINIELTDIKIGKATAEIAADYIFEPEKAVLPFSRGITYENKRIMNSGQLEKLVDHYNQTYTGEFYTNEENELLHDNPDFNIPIFVNYGVNRLVLKTPLRFRKKSEFDQFGAFEKAIENQIAFDKLFEWFFDQEFYENIIQKDKPDYQDKALLAVKTAMLAMLDDCDDIHIVAKPYSMRITKKGNNLDVLQLSDGEKCTLALFGDIARRLAIANPSLTNPLEGAGVVLIDELELHMHTLWQRKVIGALRRTFPNIQFIITTHSPQVLGEIDGRFNVISLTNEEEGVDIRSFKSLYGMDSNAILEDILKTDSVSLQIKQLVDEMYLCIESRAYDKAEMLADKVDELTLGKNADTVRARIMIRRGRMRNAQN